MLSSDNRCTALQYAVWEGHIASVEVLLDQGVEIDLGSFLAAGDRFESNGPPLGFHQG